MSTQFIIFPNPSGSTTTDSAWVAGDASALAAAQACCARLLRDADIEVAVPIGDTPAPTQDPATGLYLNDATATIPPRGYALVIKVAYQGLLTSDPWFSSNGVPAMIALWPHDPAYTPTPKPWNFGKGYPMP